MNPGCFVWSDAAAERLEAEVPGLSNGAGGVAERVSQSEHRALQAEEQLRRSSGPTGDGETRKQEPARYPGDALSFPFTGSSLTGLFRFRGDPGPDGADQSGREDHP